MNTEVTRSALPQIRAARVIVTIQGISPLMVCSWMTRGKRGALPREEQSELARYRLDDGRDGIPYAMFRGAARTAAQKSDRATRGLFLGDEVSLYTPLEFAREELHTTRVALRSKPEDLVRVVYHDWRIKLPVQYQDPIWSAASVVALLDLAGATVGIGQMRPEHSGMYGRFRVVV